MIVAFKFEPQQKLHVIPLECSGRVVYCKINGSPQPIYQVEVFINSDQKFYEFLEDELKEIE